MIWHICLTSGKSWVSEPKPQRLKCDKWVPEVPVKSVDWRKPTEAPEIEINLGIRFGMIWFSGFPEEFVD